MTEKVSKAITIRSKLRNKLPKDKNEQSRNDYRKQRNLCVTLIHRARQQYFSSLNLRLIAGNKKFWHTVKPLLSEKITHRDIIRLMEDVKTITEDLQTAEIFNNYFGNVIRSLCDRNVPAEPDIHALKMQFLQQSLNSKTIPESYLLTLYFIMLQNGQTYFKNLAVFTPQDF